MRYVALAVDYDGTLAADSAARVAPETVHALERLAASGRKVILVTGRELEGLLSVFPRLEVFDRVVAENGAVLYTPQTRTRRTLGTAPSPELVHELQRRGVWPLSVGRSIVATVHPHETTVLEAIRDLGLELNVIFNKGAVMILPASMNKASGLAAALEDLALSPRNVAAIGDAENDHAMLRIAEFGVAVANALPTLKQEADRTSSYENGRAVIELVDDLIGHDLRATPPRPQRREILLGRSATGADVRIPPAWVNVLVAGAPGSGRTALALAVLDGIAAEGYQFCAIGAAGDCTAAPGALVLGAAGGAPAVADVMKVLHKPDANVVVDLGSVSLQSRAAFVADLLGQMAELRARIGRPHWILVDELEQLADRGDALRASLVDASGGMLYLTSHGNRLPREVLATVDLAVAFGDTPAATLQGVAASWGVAAPKVPSAALGEGEALGWRRGSEDGPFRLGIAAPARADAT